jgi:hypothetical protein
MFPSNRSRVRFSLRTLLIVFVMVALALATIVSTWRLQRAEREVQRVREIYGVGSPNRYEMTAIGESDLQVNGADSFYLVRLDQPQNFRLQSDFYNGARQKGKQVFIDLHETDYEFALWYSAKPTGSTFHIRPLKGHPTSLTLPLKPAIGDKVYRYPMGVNSTIDSRPFLIYIFCPADLEDEPNFQWIGQDEQKLKDWCDKYQAKAAYFKFQNIVQ